MPSSPWTRKSKAGRAVRPARPPGWSPRQACFLSTDAPPLCRLCLRTSATARSPRCQRPVATRTATASPLVFAQEGPVAFLSLLADVVLQHSAHTRALFQGVVAHCCPLHFRAEGDTFDVLSKAGVGEGFTNVPWVLLPTALASACPSSLK